MLPQQYCLRWKYHHSNLQAMFSQLLERQAFCDVTLACEGRTIKAHKIVLSACSTFFDSILSQYEEKDPILIMKDVKFIDIQCLVEFMYRGEINVEHCHLATLLKTAEELKIKGLAEVTWRDDENNSSDGLITTPNSKNDNQNLDQHNSNNKNGGINGLQTVLPQVTAVLDNNSDHESNNSKRKRGRPPLDDYESPSYTKVPNLDNSIVKKEHVYTNVLVPDADLSGGDSDDDQQSDDQQNDDEQNFSDSKTDNDNYARSENGHDSRGGGGGGSESDTPSHSGGIQRISSLTAGSSGGNNSITNNNTASTTTSSGNKQESLATLESQWPDVIKMNDYLNTGRRPQFWEEPFTKRVMDAIKSKELEMKSAAELLGVSYGTLYGRYRDAYGCLKHPYRVRDFWSDQGPADILAKLQRQEVSLFRAAELLNVTPQTLSNYLISLNSSDLDASTSNYSYDMRDDEMDELPSGSGVVGGNGDDGDMESADESIISNHMQISLTATNSPPPLISIETGENITKTVLPNHPDITIIKKEKKKDVIIQQPTPSTQNNHPDDEHSDQ